MKEERWLPVVGYEGKYEVSDFGRLKSLKRLVKHPSSGKSTILVKERIRKLQLATNGYLCVTLPTNGKIKKITVHTLVLEAFVGKRPRGLICCHGIGGALDNSVSNLSWGTYSKNSGVDKLRDGTLMRGNKNHKSDLTEETVLAISESLRSGEKSTKISKRFNINVRTIYNIKYENCWSWLTNPEQVNTKEE